MVPAVRGSNRWLVEPTGMFHRTITQRRALVRQSKSNSNTKPKRKIPGEGDKPVSLLKRTRVPKRAFRGEKCCANGLDKADFLIDGLEEFRQLRWLGCFCLNLRRPSDS